MPLRQPLLSAPLVKTYKFLPEASTYVQGKVALDEACRQEVSTAHPIYILPDHSLVYRPLTMRENFQAQVDDFWTLKDSHGKKRTLDDRLQLFTTPGVDSCTSVAYKGGTTKFTIIPLDEALIALPANFSSLDLNIVYPTSASMSLNILEGKYNSHLTPGDVLDHEGWLAAVEGDQYLLRERVKITFSMLRERYGKQTGMGFYLQKSPSQDMRRALFVDNLDRDSSANGRNDLNNRGSFLRVAHLRRREKKKRAFLSATKHAS